MRVSIGTAHVLGLAKVKTDALPTTAYLMHGEGCRRQCKFCAQASGSGTDSKMLSRVIWPKFPLDKILYSLNEQAQGQVLKRCCIQVVDDGQEDELTQKVIGLLSTGLPLCVSKSVNTLEEVSKLLDLGVERVTIALDVVNPDIYREIKGGSFQKRWDFLLEAGKTYPGRIGTHLIAGLGESEEELIRMMSKLEKQRISVALFAFTPLKGTPLATRLQPEESIYRRVQIAHYLLKVYAFREDDFIFLNNRLVGFVEDKNKVLSLLTNGKAFETSGCPDCNRPYYNERPGGVIYNYPRPLAPEEVFNALKVTGLWSGLEIYKEVRKSNEKQLREVTG